MQNTEILVIGSGMAGLTAAALLACDGYPVTILEQNWLPGGCSSSYPRKHFWFESGATTLVGLDPGMPVHFLLEKTGISVPIKKLETPMLVYLRDGRVITRYPDLDLWIAEAERVFGPKGQRPFWEYCYRISLFVWQTSLQQRAFPPSSLNDILDMVRNFRPAQLRFAALAYPSVGDLLRKYGLDQNPDFVDFVNEQLLITAQNYLEEVNVLFGATALCYTLFSNFYVPGGMIKLVESLTGYIESRGGKIELRNPVEKVSRVKGGYIVQSKKGEYKTAKLISSLPINNTLALFDDPVLTKKYAKKVMPSASLNSAFSLGFAAKRFREFESLHHQIHLEKPFSFTQARSIFLSLSDPEDTIRCEPGQVVGSVSFHLPNPGEQQVENKETVQEEVLDLLEKRGFIRREDLLYVHSSTQKSWEKWTGRKWGFVGGYPQYLRIKPWQMIDARLNREGAYICGDSVYPGQGIPGACLSGIIAWKKLSADWHRRLAVFSTSATG
ncbi:MAG: NAD(P)/FAD-dependent oxidoreductase [Bacteroidia bacterium]|nr:NAD(P)/FAD-dependent oxidoreductase [Bacteroidia bacterium]